ncbi:DUF1415 domain-containing protein [Gynurincola endophyticus]|uniref:DUF1415 domain-containing protein n=1 Tax=Gynurincola endophyticus TaxID=2479004 RepID=UPI000F8C47F2|nr:DUF1415 domain-containing protein [Gynurincola endophyticus]
MEEIKDDHQRIIKETHEWVMKVVVGCHFCPFALPAVKNNSIRYVVSDALGPAAALEQMMEEVHFLDANEETETTLIIFPKAFQTFPSYLNLIEVAEELLADREYDGVYQIASFHPNYKFADSTSDDPSNYTNRSLYPMIHLLREESLEKALETFPDPEGIPIRNIAFAREKGLQYMQQLREMCKIQID